MRTCTGLLVAAVVLGLGASAFAGTVDAKLLGVPLGHNFSYVIGGSARTNLAGVVEWQRTGGTQLGDPSGIFRSVCIELDQYAADTTFDVIPVAQSPVPGLELGAGPMGDSKADLLSKLWAAHWDEANTSADKAAAFQVGAWEIIYDDGLDLFGGEFAANYADLASSPLFVQLANDWLAGLGNLTDRAELMALADRNSQDQLVVVPLPSAVLAGGILLSGIAAGKVRRHFKAA